jgi:hypothetical protein
MQLKEITDYGPNTFGAHKNKLVDIPKVLAKIPLKTQKNTQNALAGPGHRPGEKGRGKKTPSGSRWVVHHRGAQCHQTGADGRQDAHKSGSRPPGAAVGAHMRWYVHSRRKGHGAPFKKTKKGKPAGCFFGIVFLV